jgi:putative spermidine/putrescine transport system permease protein
MTATLEAPPAAAAVPNPRPRRVWTGLLAGPAVAVVLLFVLVPIVTMIVISLTQSASGDPLPSVLTNYKRFLTSTYYLNVLWRTVRIALESSVASLVLGYPIAIFLSRHRGVLARVVVVLLLCPLFVSVAVRAYSWNVLLAPSGPLGFLHLTFTEAAVVIGLVQYVLPFSVLSLTSSLALIDPSFATAAKTLGSSAWRVFRTVTLPLSIPGIVAAVTISFSLGVAAFAIPLLLGGGRTQVMVSLVYEQQNSVFDQGFAAAISVIMLVITLIAIVATNVVSRRMQAVR